MCEKSKTRTPSWRKWNISLDDLRWVEQVELVECGPVIISAKKSWSSSDQERSGEGACRGEQRDVQCHRGPLRRLACNSGVVDPSICMGDSDYANDDDFYPGELSELGITFFIGQLVPVYSSVVTGN